MSPVCNHTIQYNTTLLPSVNTMIAQGMFCGAKYTHHTFTPIIKHLITTTAKTKNKTKIQVKSHSQITTWEAHSTVSKKCTSNHPLWIARQELRKILTSDHLSWNDRCLFQFAAVLNSKKKMIRSLQEGRGKLMQPAFVFKYLHSLSSWFLSFGYIYIYIYMYIYEEVEFLKSVRHWMKPAEVILHKKMNSWMNSFCIHPSYINVLMLQC